MRALTASEIIRVWETAYRFHPVDQALTVLQQVMPDYTREQLAAIPLGRRDTLLLALHQTTFGDALPGVSTCRQCNAAVEFELSCSALTQNTVDPLQQILCRDEYNLAIRPLNSFDLAVAAAADTLEDARELLLHRCVIAAQYNGQAVALDTLPSEIVELITASALESDPQAEILLDLNCPACKHQWQSMLDIGQFLWEEISVRAQQLLMEVHQLAQSYGWSEDEILKLSPIRRAAYVQMVAI